MPVTGISNSRPNFTYGISQLSQVTESMCHSDVRKYIKMLNVVVKRAREDSTPIMFPKMALYSIRMVGYSDASFSGNHDLTSQLGRIVLLMYNSGAELSDIGFVLSENNVADGLTKDLK